MSPPASAIGVTVLIGGSRRSKPARTRRKMLAPFPDAVDAAAVDDFTERHGDPRFAPVLVVIAAYNEQDGIGGVLDNLPA
ncbi:MAG TPA: glycosyltransferase family 2 protein, partial [Pseudonocardiaceae bacterium]